MPRRDSCHRIPHQQLQAGLLLLALCLSLMGCSRQASLIEQQFFEFGTLINVSIISDDKRLALSLLEDIEADLGRYRSYWHGWETSDLTRFNAQLHENGEADIPSSLLELLRVSQRYYWQSDGLFNPAMGRLIAAWGFHGKPADEALINAIQADIPGMHDLMISDNRATSRNPWVQVDLGGIAKGLAVRNIAQHLRDNGIADFVVNAGGDLQVSGNRFGRPWRLGIRHPFAPGVIAGIELDGNYSLFTSGNYERRYKKGEQNLHHIIDPISGRPSTKISSATVLADDPVLADVAATVLMVDGLRQPQALMQRLGITDYLVIDEQQTLTASPGMAKRLQSVSGTQVVVLD